MKKIFILIVPSFFILSCSENGNEADAYGNFEATEVTVSSETNGRILQYIPEEGSQIKKAETIALIDTTLFSLQKAELIAGMNGIRTKLATIDAQNAILNQQIENLSVNIKRTEKMLADEAVPLKQMDDLTGQRAVFEKQIAANNTQKNSIASELQVFQSKLKTLNEQIDRSSVKSPLDGTIIQKYAEEGELATTGKPIAKIAELGMMKLKVYVSGASIGDVKTGQKCIVRTDKGEKGFSEFSGTVSYISPKAEFTPKIIQTKEERVTLVYAVTINVENDGTIKSGMPGEAIFKSNE
ncbi:MAG TPA: HlyD family efflux transporter periplasmic adaptor subunit [Bacteroidales bacterium]|nr:HlyD family efflux transporter periplasmic adaptor subunit [Bacteroidales bacterium]